MNRYEFRQDDAFLVETMRHHLGASSRRGWQRAVKIVCAAGLVALLVFLVVAAFAKPLVLVIASIPLVFLALLAAGPRFDYWLACRRFRRSPFYQSNVVIDVEASGVSMKSDKASSELKWLAFDRVTTFEDGFLVASGPSVSYWWPNSALRAGTIEDVARLLKTHVHRDRSPAA
jgi:hypothetical protein